MEKPLVLIVKETEEKIIKTINESKVPAFIIKNSIKEIYEQLLKLEIKELEIARNNYTQPKNRKDGEK